MNKSKKTAAATNRTAAPMTSRFRQRANNVEANFSLEERGGIQGVSLE